MDQRRRLIKPGELLAIRPDVVQEDRGSFFWLFAPPTPKTTREGVAAVVRINGPLEYHDEGYCDSYESVVCRVEKALKGEDVVEAWRAEHRWDDEPGDEPQACPPKCVVLRIDSPGGVVAGLTQTVDKLRKMSKAAGIPLYAYADETAYSAAYALSCACSEIYLPKAGMVGSIGVISTMVDVTKMDQKHGVKFVILTSGKRKADGHPHVPISDAMVAEEAPRVLTLARQFYDVVKRARGLSLKSIRGFEAARFLGDEALRAGVADETMSWDRFIAMLQVRAYDGTTGLAQPGTTVSTSTKPQSESPMPLSLDALIERTEKAIAGEKDPSKLAALGASLESYKKTKHSIEKHETEEGDEDEDEDDEEESAEGDETDRSDDEDDDEDDEDDDGDDAESEEESKKAFVKSVVTAAGITDRSKRIAFRSEVTKLVGSLASGAARQVYEAAVKLTGKKAPGRVVAALEGAVAGAKDVKDRLAAIEKTQRKERRENMVTGALNSRRITRHEAKDLRTKSLAFVEEFLKMRPKAIIDHDEAQMPHQGPKGGGGSGLPESVQKQLDDAAKHAKAMGLKNFDPQKVADEALKLNGKVPVV